MKLGLGTKRGKRNTTMQKKIDDDVISANHDVFIIFPVYGGFGAAQKLDSKDIVCNF